MWMMRGCHLIELISRGLCKCGCGKPTKLAGRNRADRGWVKGQPVPFIHGHNPTIPLFRRVANFWKMTSLLPESGWPDCIEWTGALSPGGYGHYTAGIFGEGMAHRIAYMLTFGLIPKGLEPDHLCRNRKCINPYHLEAVTRTVNVRRGARARLTESLASEIRASLESERVIARRLGVSRGAIQAVRSRRTWN